MTNEQLDALLRRLDVPSTPDPSFVTSSHAALQDRVRTARARDGSWIGRMVRYLRLTGTITTSPAVSRRVILVATVCLLMLALAAGLLIVGALRQPTPLGNGLLLVSAKGQLEAIDPTSGSAQPILPASEKVEGVSRSPDGRVATFWINGTDRSRLFAIGVDGRDRHELAKDLSVTWNPSIDTWSWDSRFLATEVNLDGQARILVVDVATGAARAITPPTVAAHNPLWSPDGLSVAFSRDTATRHTLSAVHVDGSGMQDLKGIDGIDVNGPDTWSPDGQWIYFGGGDANDQHAFRVNVLHGDRERLSPANLYTPAVASSPDGTRIVFNADAGSTGWDLWVANSDGTAPHLLLKSGNAGSWSSDAQHVITVWRPVDGLGGLATIRPNGSDFRVLVPFDPSCANGADQTCVLGFGWGVARP
jgi:Tol biopolymer transport system component